MAPRSVTTEYRASVGQVIGLLKAIDEAGGREDVAQIAREGKLDADSIPALISLAERLGLVEVHDGDVVLRDHGRRVLQASIPERKKVLAGLLDDQDWMQEVLRVLRARGGSAARSEVLDALGAKFGTYRAEILLDAAVYWGRYGGLLKYSSASEKLRLVE